MNMPISPVPGRIANSAPPVNPQPAAPPRAAPVAVEKPVVTQASVAPQSARAQSEYLQKLDEELTAANQKLAGAGNELRFEYDRKASQVIVRLVDGGTSEVIRQYPSEDAMRIARLVVSGKSVVNMKA